MCPRVRVILRCLQWRELVGACRRVPARLLAPRHVSGHSFLACGFAKGEPAGVFSSGILGERRTDETVQIESPSGIRVQPGFSGAPVWDEHARGIVGMVVSSWKETEARAAFVIPSGVLISASGDRLRLASSVGPFGALTGGLSRRKLLEDFLKNYLGTPEHPAPFGGRDAELERLDEWLDHAERPYILIAAPAGRGKSALLAHWAIEVAESNRADVVLVPIDMRFASDQLSDVNGIVNDRLRFLLPETAGLSEQELRAVLFEGREAGERPLLLVFDSLDQASGWRPEHDLDIPPYSVPGIRVLVSARLVADRNGSAWLRDLGWQNLAETMTIGTLDRHGIREVLVSLKVKDAETDRADDLIAAVHEASDGGDPLLVGLFAEAIGPGGFVQADRLPELGVGLNAYFDAWWDAQRSFANSQGRDAAQEADRASLVFDLLACARGPLTVDELCQLTGIPSANIVSERLREFGRWVIAVGADNRGQRTYSFAHPRLREYWRDPTNERMTVRARQQTVESLLTFCEAQLHRLLEGANPTTASPYALRYYATHLEKEQADYQQFDALVCREWWHAHRAVSGSNETFPQRRLVRVGSGRATDGLSRR